MNRKYGDLVFFGTIVCGVLVDLVTKWWANLALSKESIAIIPDLLTLSLAKNDGIAFGMDIPGIIFLTPILIILIALHYWQVERKKHTISITLGFALILAGALGNGWERVAYEEVTDFIFVHGFSVFNVADVCINIGVVILIVGFIFEKKRAKHDLS